MRLRPIRWWRVLPVKVAAGLMAIGSGLALGRQGPTIHMGASVGKVPARKGKTNELERRGLIARGAAAGLAPAFNTARGAALFVMGETRRQFTHTFTTHVGVGLAAFAATCVTQALSGPTPDLLFAAGTPALSVVAAFLLPEIICGLLGVAMNRSQLSALDPASAIEVVSPCLLPAMVGGDGRGRSSGC